MISKNHSYFDRELCLDGHYIITGRTNDQFCNDILQLTDIRMELHRYLRFEEHFQAVFFLDASNMLYCYDQQSFDILRNNALTPVENSHQTENNENLNAVEIESSGPLGRRRRRRSGSENRAPQPVMRQQGALHMGRMNLPAAWQQVIAVMQNPNLRCALILNNINSLQHSLQNPEMVMLEELQSHHQVNHSIVVYLFRDTSLSNILDSGRHGSGQWATYVETTLRPRIDTEDPASNRVICLGTPNRYEVRNLLNYLRLKPENRLNIRQQEIGQLAEKLAASCARQRWSLANLLTRLDVFCLNHKNTALSLENWREFTGEQKYVSPMEQLERLIGMKEVKRDIKDWYALQKMNQSKQKEENKTSSRFAPQVVSNQRVGHSLNIRLKGNPGTGKTTLARLMGLLYYELGLLPQGQLIECTASDLVSAYVGDTAGTVRERVQEAMGGVLFIDEAYSLATNDHGLEAINQLVNDMSTYQGQFAVIIAGYPNDIDNLIRQNDGLARRFPMEYTLPDYTAEELQQIFRQMAKSDPSDISFSESLEERMEDFFEAWVGGRTREWGNAGEAENLLTSMKKACSARIAGSAGSDGHLVFTEADIPESLRHCLAPRSKDLEEALREIDQMIGLKNVKQFLRELVNNIQWGAVEKVPGNYIFYGPPGTGKTTVARKIGEILGHLNILRRKTNNVTECRAADLLNGSMTLQEAVENARGGILFLDEAHQLEQVGGRGHAIIRELVPIVEDPEIRSDTCFICAGYSAEMKRFLNVDGGLSRRFPVNNRIRFNDYTAEELVQILELMVKERGEKLDKEKSYLTRSHSALERYMERRPRNFGNGGFIRDVYLPESIKARTARLNKKAMGKDTTECISAEKVALYSEEEKHTLTAEDIPASFVRLAGPIGMDVRRKERNYETLLDELIGKKEIVDFVKSHDSSKSAPLFFDADMDTGRHLAICGPTGVGKHTAVRAIASAWRHYGYLERDDVEFVTQADLVAGYVGQTAGKTQNVIEHALGGTLAIEYPSSMIQKNSNDNSFGPEALGVIIGAMSAYAEELCVIFLDTKEGMDLLLRAYPSLKSHLAQVFELEELGPEEIKTIFELKTKESFAFTKETQNLLPDFFLNWVSDRGGLGEAVQTWGNGQEADQLIEALITNWKNLNGRVITENLKEGERIITFNKREITKEMFPEKYRKYLKETRVLSKNALNQLEEMTGLRSVKRSIETIERRMRRMSKKNVIPGCYCFLGNPGTGKTTVAKLMGGILKSTGVLSQGHVIVRTAREMCEQLPLFDYTLKLARNGILFVDEAHQLRTLPGGSEVIKRLLTVLEDVEVVKNTCIILAGYPVEMFALLDMDQGLKSRFGLSDSLLFFEDYTAEELGRIMREMAKNANHIPQIGTDYSLILTEEYQNRSMEIFRAICEKKDPKFGNARFVRNYLHDSIDAQLLRIDEEYGREDEPSEQALSTLMGADIPIKYKKELEKQSRKANIQADFLNNEVTKGITSEDYNERCEALAQSVVLLENSKNGTLVGTATGTIISSDGYILTCAHVVKDNCTIRARIYSPGMVGGDYRWFECEVCEPICKECDMAVLKIQGSNFKTMSMRATNQEISGVEETLILGYPLGGRLNGESLNRLTISNFQGRIASIQEVNQITRYYINSKGLHGNSGSPVISTEDGRMIGVFSGSITSKGTLDELNYFYPITYFWEKYLS